MKNSIELEIDKLKEDIGVFDDNMEKYDFIIDYGDTLQDLDEKYWTDENKVLGCQSNLWIYDFGTKKTNFKAYADAKIVRGLAAMILQIYNGKTYDEILSCDPKVLNNLGIASLLTPGRQNGIGNLIAKIYEIAHKRTGN